MSVKMALYISEACKYAFLLHVTMIIIINPL
jgi:hypothetical protein